MVGPNQVRVFIENVNSVFFALILAVKTSPKEIISELFEMTNQCSKDPKTISFFLFRIFQQPFAY